MEQFDGHQGISRLASVLSRRMKKKVHPLCYWISGRYRRQEPF